MNNFWRITKYNPDFRDSQGSYFKDDWTSISDLGKSFSGNVFTIQEYLKIEQKYVDTVLLFVKYLKIPGLKVKNLMKWTEEFIYSEYYSKEMINLYNSVKENDLLDSDKLMNLCKLVLRENLGCQLLYEDKIFIHFGYDYYMYVGCTESCDEVIQKVSQLGLFVEQIESPYTDDKII